MQLRTFTLILLLVELTFFFPDCRNRKADRARNKGRETYTEASFTWYMFLKLGFTLTYFNECIVVNLSE